MRSAGTPTIRSGNPKSLMPRAGSNRVPGEDPRKDDDDHDFHRFRRLNGKKPQMEPAGGPHGGLPHEQHQQQEHHHGPVDPVGNIIQEVIIDTADRHHQGQAGENPVDLFQVIRGACQGVGRCCAVDIENPDGSDDQRQAEKGPVEAGEKPSVDHRHGCPPGLRVIGQSPSVSVPAAELNRSCLTTGFLMTPLPSK